MTASYARPVPANDSEMEARPAAQHARSIEEFETLYKEQFSFVVRTLRRLGVRDGDLEDVAHELFVSVHRHFSEYDAMRGPRAWLWKFAYRFAADYRRLARHRGRSLEDLPGELVSQARNQEQQMAEGDARRVLLAALETIDDLDRRATLVMHDLDDMSMPEITTALGIPLNTGYSKLRLARQELKVAVKKILGARGLE